MRNREINTGIVYTNDRCIGCNKCIYVCPTMDANIAVLERGSNKIYVDQEKCIHCGKCIDVCTHEARCYKDDAEAFLQDLKAGHPISVLLAPAFLTNYPDTYRQIMSYLRGLGVKAFYSVSFGADITTWCYLNYLKDKPARGIVSQPCPTVVNYILKFKPELADRLIPIHSPVLNAAIYLKKYRDIPEKLAFIGPCIAKKDEAEQFPEYIGYNVTFASLLRALGGAHLKQAPDGEFDLMGGIGAVYAMPGGLRTNVEYYLGYDMFVMQIEGEKYTYDYLNQYAQRQHRESDLPDLIDVLNCSRGCNYGTGTEFKHTLDDRVARVMNQIQRENSQLIAVKQPAKRRFRRRNGKKESPSTQQERLDHLNEQFRDLRMEDFMRSYRINPVQPLSAPPDRLEGIYREMRKFLPEDREIDCGRCGYRTCRDMAVAIYNGINYHNNCIYYVNTVLEEEKEKQRSYIEEMSADFTSIHQVLEKLGEDNLHSLEAGNQISRHVNSISEISEMINSTLSEIQQTLQQLETANGEIVTVSQKTDLLALNASVEAARAGAHGKGFAVVAQEVRSLSQSINETADNSIESSSNVISIIMTLADKLRSLDTSAGNAQRSTDGIRDSVDNITTQIDEILEITNHLLQKYKVEPSNQ